MVGRGLAALAILAVFTTTSCSHDSPDPVRDRGAGSAESPLVPSCEGVVPAGCQVAAGVRFFVYGNPTSDEMVLLDLGGPGVNVGDTPGLDEVVGEVPASVRSSHRIVVMEEPWVVSPTQPSARCRAASARWLQAVRDQLPRTDPSPTIPTAAHKLWGDCADALNEAGWSPSTYNKAIDAVEERLDARLTAFVGISYGGVRRLYLDERHQPTWTLLVDPAPYPHGPDGLASMIADRANAIASNVNQMCQTCVTTWPDDLTATAAALDDRPVAVPGRSIPVTGADVYAAAVLIGRQPATTASSLLSALTSGGHLTDDQAALVASVSDGALSRYGTVDLAPQALAYVDEVCRSYQGQVGQVHEDVLKRTLGVMHSNCDGRTIPAFALSKPIGASVSCIGVHANDFVATTSIDGWEHAYPTTDVEQLPPNTHGYLNDVPCWKALEP